MSLLVFGRNGQVATALARLAPDACFIGRKEFDLSAPGPDGAALYDWVMARVPSAVINAAAYTAVDRAEAEEPLATTINAAAPGAMAEACATLGIPFLTISTDYVFDGSGSAPWAPDAPTGPLNAYGRSKLAGERAVQAAGGTTAILRTSWVFSSEGANFLKTMLHLSQTRDALSIVDDQIGGPTPAEAVARAALTVTQAMTGGHPGGIWHIAGAPYASWAEFAAWIFTCAGRQVAITPIASADYPTPAPRPLNSRLDCTTLARDFTLCPPDWKAQAHADVKGLLT